MRPHPVVVSALKMVCAVAPGWRIIPIPDIIDKVCKDPEIRKKVLGHMYSTFLMLLTTGRNGVAEFSYVFVYLRAGTLRSVYLQGKAPMEDLP